MNIIIWTIQILLAPALSPLFIGIVRKAKAKMQNRQGAGIFQPYRDMAKLFRKDEVISSDASWIFRFSPYAVFSVTIALGLCVPLFSSALQNSFTGDFLVVVYLVALGAFFLALSGMDAGSAFGGFGSSREMTVAALTEGGLIFSLLSLAISAKSTNLFSIASSVSSLQPVFMAPVILAFIAFIIAALAETARFPFDNPATHLELTMIHEAMILEYSGKRLALMEWAAANKFFIFMALAANLFFPWGISSGASLAAIVIGLSVLSAKILILTLFVAVLESSIAKFRLFRLPDLLFISFILSAISISLIL
ncbi:MAG TPA: NADH-quinone oxidoreductase subunit H [Candidatus Paceibacterota bacterium]|nr:NADH-quinone oxidoreductase subunit H [Candidatus Paceibacterota bacterium]